MNDTPRSTDIRDNIHVAMVADNREQSISHFEEAHREIEAMERELTAVTEQRNRLAEALKNIASGNYSWPACVDKLAPEALQSLTTNEL